MAIVNQYPFLSVFISTFLHAALLTTLSMLLPGDCAGPEPALGERNVWRGPLPLPIPHH